MAYLSSRARQNLARTPAQELRSHCFRNQYDAETNPDGIVALAVAENKLMHPEVSAYITRHFQMTPAMLTYMEGPAGSRALRQALARFLTERFRPRTPLEESAVCVCNGVGSAVDNLAFCVGEPGDGILIGRPLYVGFLPDMAARAKYARDPSPAPVAR